MHISKKLPRCLAGIACALCASVASAELAVIVSAKNPITALRADQVADIFLGKAGTFPTGAPAVPIDAPESHPIRGEFYATLVGKTGAQLRAHWSKLIFTGKGQPPRVMANSESIKKLVADHPQLIGYVDRSAVDSSVKVVIVDAEAGK
jgi:ABC-type phosphate transport system substrate-binding protein